VVVGKRRSRGYRVAFCGSGRRRLHDEQTGPGAGGEWLWVLSRHGGCCRICEIECSLVYTQSLTNDYRPMIWRGAAALPGIAARSMCQSAARPRSSLTRRDAETDEASRSWCCPRRRAVPRRGLKRSHRRPHLYSCIQCFRTDSPGLSTRALPWATQATQQPHLEPGTGPGAAGAGVLVMMHMHCSIRMSKYFQGPVRNRICVQSTK
jgi:hypothetical protein